MVRALVALGFLLTALAPQAVKAVASNDDFTNAATLTGTNDTATNSMLVQPRNRTSLLLIVMKLKPSGGHGLLLRMDLSRLTHKERALIMSWPFTKALSFPD